MNRLLSFILLVVAASSALQVCLAQDAGIITVGGSDRCMAMAQSNFSNGAKPQTLMCRPGKPAHTWQFLTSSTSGQSLLQVADSTCLDIPGGIAWNGAPVQVWQCNTYNNHQYFARDGNLIRWNGSQYCLDVRDGSAHDFASHLVIQLWTCNPAAANQEFIGPGTQTTTTVTSASTDAKLAKTTSTVKSSSTVKTTSSIKTTSSVKTSSIKTTSSVKTTSTPVSTAKSTAKSTTQKSTSSTTSSHTTSTVVSTSKTTTSSAKLTTISTNPRTTTFTVATTTASTATSASVPTFSSKPKPALTSIFKPTAKRMLPWGFNNEYAAMIGVGPKISSYMHWELGIVPQMPSDVTYIPTYWGPALNSSWVAVESQFTGIPGAILGFNEPDLASQANITPSAAAALYYNNITIPYGLNGANMISPSISWNVNGWLAPFLTECALLGCGIDAVGAHYYVGIDNDTDSAVNYITSSVNALYAKFGLPLVLGEIGLTEAGGGTDAQMMDFAQQICEFMDNSPAVLAYGLSSVFTRGDGWDNYLNSNFSFFETAANGTVSLTPLAEYYMYS